MHPRNRYYAKPADFLQLSKSYPALQPYVIQRTTEYGTVDFSNNKAVKQLTKALLAQDFDLEWDIDEGHLVPTIPLRLNYLHWIEDLLSEYEGMVPRGHEVQGLDIGVGASCIYPLLGVKMNEWKFYGTEILDNSLYRAKETVLANKLGSNIKLAKPIDNSIILGLMESEWRDVKFSFVMCNPPFYASIKDKTVPENRTQHRPSNSSSQQECMLDECVTEGGELKFVKKIIEESLNLRNRVTWFTSMVGRKCHVTLLLKVLQTAKIPKIAQTEFVQGKTRRWGIAWSFDVHFKSCVQLFTPALQKPLFIQLHTAKEHGAPVKTDKILMSVLESLQLEIEVYDVSKYICIAYRDTWSNQRRKKRMEKMRESFTMEEDSKVMTGCKRKYSDSEVMEEKAVKLDSTEEDRESCLIEFLVEVKKGKEIEWDEYKKGMGEDDMYKKGMGEDDIYLRLEALETTNKEFLHQIAQYIKNNTAL